MIQSDDKLSTDINFPKVLFMQVSKVAQSPNDDIFMDLKFVIVIGDR